MVTASEPLSPTRTRSALLPTAPQPAAHRRSTCCAINLTRASVGANCVLRLLGGDPGFQRREEEAWAWLLERERRGENGAAL